MLCSIEKCFGCMACYNICPVNAIDIIEDDEGFNRPKIDNYKCIKCKKCTNSCAVINRIEVKKDFNKQAYACWQKDNNIRVKSTSGGLFTALSNYIFKNNGVIFGAAFDNDFGVIHKCIDKREHLNELRGSKYVQSNIGKSYSEVKKLLQDDRKVLFTGTPCQVAGLYKFLGQKYENLFTCDLVCHGVPSPKIYKSYLKYIKEKYNSEIKSLNFRYKKPGWKVFSMKIEFENGKEYINNTNNDPYIRGFLREIFLRPSCHKCDYANIDRVSDITMADFWGYIPTNELDWDNDRGISLALINTKKGELIFNECRNELEVFKRDLSEAIAGNKCLSSCFEASDKRENFWRDYKTQEFKYMIKKYMYKEKKSLKYRIVNYTDYDTRQKIKRIIRILKFK